MQAALLPVPFEETTSFLKGCAGGPRAILEAMDALEARREALILDVRSRWRIILDGSCEDASSSYETAMARLEQSVSRHLREGRLPVILGGEHAITYGAFLACHAKHPDLDILQCDAHSDLRDSYEGTAASHACVMRRIVELDAGRVVAAGVRSQTAEEAAFIRSKGITLVPPAEIAACAQGALGDPATPLYLTLDMDFFDPSVAPGVGTPEPGGVRWSAGLAFLLSVCSRRRLAALDIVELLPIPGQPHTQALAARVLCEVLLAQAELLNGPHPSR